MDSDSVIPFQHNPERVACLHCGKYEEEDKVLFRCSRCKTGRYCDRKCQKADWKVHRAVCPEITAETAEFQEEFGDWCGRSIRFLEIARGFFFDKKGYETDKCILLLELEYISKDGDHKSHFKITKMGPCLHEDSYQLLIRSGNDSMTKGKMAAMREEAKKIGGDICFAFVTAKMHDREILRILPLVQTKGGLHKDQMSKMQMPSSYIEPSFTRSACIQPLGL